MEFIAALENILSQAIHSWEQFGAEEMHTMAGSGAVMGARACK